ncbi:hypothetical protein JCM8208_004139 [Rhodotorula glutinis]
MPSHGTPAPGRAATSPAPPHLSPDLAAYLRDLPLPACVFSHADLATSTDLQPPIFVTSALEALLAPAASRLSESSAETADGLGSTRAQTVTLVDVLDDESRADLCDWLVEGADLALASSSPSSPTLPPAAPPRRPPFTHAASSSRHVVLQVDPLVSFSKLRWRATTSPGYTILTLLPSSEAIHSGEIEVPELGHPQQPKVGWTQDGPTRSRPATVQGSRRRLGGKTPRESLGGGLDISLAGARNAVSLEGLAYTAWHSPVGQFRLSRDLSVTQANNKWRDTVGLVDEASNDSWPSHVHPDDRERVLAHYQGIRETLPCERDEFEFRWVSDGRDKWCVCVLEPAAIGGIVDGYCGFLVNVSKHKEIISAAEAQASQLRSELAVLSDCSAVGLSRHTINGRFLATNSAWWVITRLAPTQSPDSWQQQVHPDDYERVHEAWETAFESKDPLTIQFRWKHGTTSLVQVAPNHYDKDRVTGWIGSFTDTSAQARLEEAVLNFAKQREVEAKVRADEAEVSRKAAVEEKRQQEVLIDVTSHEIRNPISAIIQNASFTRSSLEAVRADFLDLKAHDALPAVLDAKIDELGEDIEALDAVMDCGMAQERIANDILGLAQIQLSKYTITPVLFDLAQSLRTMIHMFRSECRTKGIELRLVVDPSFELLGPQARVVADPARLTQILVNLLTNAIRFTAQADTRIVTLSADVRSRVPGESEPPTPPSENDPPRQALEPGSPVFLCFSVEDTGLGMTEEETSRVFAKFTQASPETQSKWGGSGLGLWIARNLCRLQGGRIKVQSSPGKGSTFRCFITARSADAATATEVDLGKENEPVRRVVEGGSRPVASRGTSGSSEGARGEKTARLKGLKVLCCEDNAINRSVLRKQLAKEGCDEILMACDGQEGVDLLREQPGGKVDCVLMDIEMPILDGLAATRVIRTAEHDDEAQSPTSPSRRQRIVGLTGNARDAQLQAGLDAGMDALVTKPYKVPDLVDKILDTLGPSSVPTSPSSSPVVGPAAEPPQGQAHTVGEEGTVEAVEGAGGSE